MTIVENEMHDTLKEFELLCRLKKTITKMNASIIHWPKIRKTILMASDFFFRRKKVFTQPASVKVTLSSLTINNGDIGSHYKSSLKWISHSRSFIICTDAY